MGLTQFPSGITSMGIPIIGGAYLTTGDVHFADSATGSNATNRGSDKDHAFADLDYAVGQCTAGKADFIFAMPEHAENISGAAGITSDKAGITIVGLGNGSARPKFSFTAAAATFVISAANTSYINVEWEAKYADVAIGLDISAVDGTSFGNCHFTENTGGLNWVSVLDLATGSSNLTIGNCRFIGSDASNDSFIELVAHDGLFIYDSLFYANTAQGTAYALINATGAVTNTDIKRCSFRSNVDGALFIISDNANNSGVIADCSFSSIDTAGAVTTGIDWTGAHVFECYVAGDADSYGLVGGGTVYSN